MRIPAKFPGDQKGWLYVRQTGPALELAWVLGEVSPFRHLFTESDFRAMLTCKEIEADSYTLRRDGQDVELQVPGRGFAWVRWLDLYAASPKDWKVC